MFVLATFHFSKLIIVCSLQIAATQSNLCFFKKNRSPMSVTSYKLKLTYHHLKQIFTTMSSS